MSKFVNNLINKIMKTYIAFNRNNHQLTTMANNKKEAAEKMKVAEYRVKLSAVHYDYCSGIKIK